MYRNNLIFYILIFGLISYSPRSYLATFLNEKILPQPEGVASFSGEFGSEIKFDNNKLVVSGPNLSVNGAVIYFELENGKWVEKQQILPLGNTERTNFGSSISIFDNLLVIGAPSNSQSLSNDAVYIYHFIGGKWLLSKKITGFNISTESFGSKVSTNGSEIAISANNCVFTFVEKDCVIIINNNGQGWSEEQYVVADGHQSPLGFNSSILLLDKHLFIGASRDRTISGSLTGAVYEFIKVDGEWEQKQKIIGSDGFRYDEFGTSVIYNSGTLLVGAPGHDAAGTDNGAVYEFKTSDGNWIESNIITLPSVSEHMFFGYSLNLLDNKMLVGRKSSFSYGTFSDNVYFFEKTNEEWNLIQTITNPYMGRIGSFGQSVVLTDNSIIVGEPTAQDGNWTGYIHGFKRSGSGWVHDWQIEPLTGSAGASFGADISSSSRYLFVSSPDKYIDVDKRGVVHVYENTDNGYELQTVLKGSKNYPHYQFGYNIISTESVLAVGSPNDQETGQFGGAVHIYDPNSSWNQIQKIIPEEYGEESHFGMSVSLDENQMVISAPFKKINNVSIGAVYLYENINNNWMFKTLITPPEELSDDRFGRRLYLEKNHLLIKSLYNNDISWGIGEVDMYYNDGQNWNHIQRFTDLNENYRAIGNQIHIEGDLAAISAITVENNFGVIFLLRFNGSTWDFEQTVYPEDFFPNNQFGYSVLINKGILYVGSINDDEFGYSSGAIYEFKKLSDTWVQSKKIFAKNVPSEIRFGSSISINQGNICVGAPLDSDRGLHSGAVYCSFLDLFHDGFEVQ